ncbi:hypothetical protein L1987_65287 [Smallanthus sonchifolius]|uniref:Uncharacterized protein n=1 Tax=Smallanthus sonchifolius TaxID=185202 RepID=A0ACB9BU40_9ASTR|nr:hypothetical protein L1987_65287 [Smallanthus sonchifolius]
MSTARSHENSTNKDTEEPSEHSSSSRSTSVSRSLNIRLNTELPIAAPTADLRSRPIARRTWPQGMSPPRKPQPQQPPRLPSPRHQLTSIHEVGGPSNPIVGIRVGRLPPGSWERDYLLVERVRQLHDQGFEHEMRLHHHKNLMDQNTVSTPMRLERPKARTRENARKRTHLTKKVIFKNLEIGEPHSKAPQGVTPRESTKEYVQLYGYFDRKDEVNESLGWLTSRGTDMKARLDFHTDYPTNMSGQMNELEQDIMQNHERTTNAIRDAPTARIQS